MLVALLAVTTSLLLAPPPDTAAHGPVADSARRAAADARTLQLRPHLDGVGVWVGGSLQSSTLIAKMKGARFGLVGLQFGRILATEDHIAARYTADLIPAAVLTYPSLPVPDGQSVAPGASPIYGMGVAPAGLQFIYRIDHRVQPFFGGSGGLMYFPAPIPDGRGRKLNYTFDVSVGVRWVWGAHRVLTVGYRFHHLSNGFRGEINPGFDANIFYIGLSTM